MTVSFRCPHCALALALVEGSYVCATGHRFDRAREGYVNLMVGGRLAGGPSGDDDTMVRARRTVFDAGCYDPVIDAVATAVATAVPGAAAVLDAGCGEGTYLARACASGAQGWGIDISKVAVRLAARRHVDCRFAVASVYRLPFEDGVFDAVIDVFSPRPFDELFRVVRPGGVVVVVTPGPDHLGSLKGLLYERPRPHVDDEHAPEPASESRVRFTVDLADAGLRSALLEMTPYWWSATEAQRVTVSRDLTSVDADMVLRTYRVPG